TVGQVGAIFKMVQLKQWGWFSALLFFPLLAMLVYIISGPETPPPPKPIQIPWTPLPCPAPGYSRCTYQGDPYGGIYICQAVFPNGHRCSKWNRGSHPF